MKAYKLTDIAAGKARVVDRAAGRRLGSVVRREKRWSLQRTYVYRWWEATTSTGERLQTEFKTREEAASALARHIEDAA